MALENKAESLAEQVSRIVAALEALDQEKAAISAAIRDTFAQAKLDGLDVKALKQVVKERKMEEEVREELNATVMAYEQALTDAAQKGIRVV